jgi:hypothetical protein
MTGQSVNVDFSQAVKNLPREVIREFKRDQNSTKPKRSTSSKSSSSDTGVGTGYGQGGQAGAQVESDVNELKSGRFAGIFEGKVDSLKKLKDAYKSQKKLDPKGDMPLPLGTPSSSTKGLESSSRPQEVKELKVRDLKVEKFIQGGPSGPGGMIGGTQGGGNEKISGAAGSSLSGVNALGIPIGALAGLSLKLGSSLAGMYQGVMQGQDRTLDATGGYMGGGGSLVNNAELAQISVARAQLLGGSAKGRTQSYTVSGVDSAGNYIERRGQKYGTGIDAGMRFGQSQGIGAGQGSEFFTKLEKFGEFMGNRSEMKKIFADGVEAGFGGLKMQQFVREIVGVSENAYKSGLGIQSAADVANSFSSLSQMGIRDERVGAVHNNMNRSFAEDGSLLSSISMMANLQNGGSILEGYAEAEKGLASKQNRDAAKSFFSDFDPETQGIIMKQNNLMTGTESLAMRNSGMSPFDRVPSDLSKGGETLGRMDRAGQEPRAKGNALDEMVAFSDAAKGAYNIQIKITEELIKTYKATEKLGKNIFDIVGRMK